MPELNIAPAAVPGLAALLEKTAALHSHLCPRQVLGARTGLLAARLFGLDLPQMDKRLSAFVETDGCFADGLSVATGCWLGRRTLRLVDYGKVAATLVDTQTGQALRIAPRIEARLEACSYAPDVDDRWRAQLLGYQTMPEERLLRYEPVRLTIDVAALVSRPGLRVPCAQCGEEIMNEREVLRDGQALCRRCAGVEGYYE